MSHIWICQWMQCPSGKHTATHCNALQHSATRTGSRQANVCEHSRISTHTHTHTHTHRSARTHTHSHLILIRTHFHLTHTHIHLTFSFDTHTFQHHFANTHTSTWWLYHISCMLEWQIWNRALSMYQYWLFWWHVGLFSMARREGTGTWPDYMVNRADKKNRGHSGKILARKSRNSCNVNGQGYGYIEANLRNPRSKYKGSKNVVAVTSIALSLSHLAPRLLQLLAQSLLQNMVSFIGLFCKRDLSMSCLN